jgi:WhiB family redox-sensing transcriptional regulator
MKTYDPPPWMLSAACRYEDAETFFPSTAQGVAYAQAICDACAVKEECGKYALSQRIAFGVWGGMSERERRRILGIKLRR